ncbi:hypothetical protein FPSE_04607 [Fusarium pseudograminearum CS3096]|uniref:Uncharacterized protein n=1 Tax=Fusarium pseudograminearum (strain CS3096) TaxID=1028729 RepID=K3US41_FUSPC|nr:hypothetical protein FPSE_04607 [Fusarium pseudograminearum CS3096]EKJ75216.1 hypothetical protein FPSE_04607 [Fusarium pseudograminearum CS3096]
MSYPTTHFMGSLAWLVDLEVGPYPVARPGQYKLHASNTRGCERVSDQVHDMYCTMLFTSYDMQPLWGNSDYY